MKRRKPIRRSRIQAKSNRAVQKIIAREQRKKPKSMAARRDLAERKERRDAEWCRVYGSEERVAWVQSLPSVVSGERPCVNAHTRSGGMGRKADYCWIVPLTDAEHHELHQHGVKTFEKKHGLVLDMAAGTVEWAWRRRNDAS